MIFQKKNEKNNDIEFDISDDSDLEETKDLTIKKSNIDR